MKGKEKEKKKNDKGVKYKGEFSWRGKRESIWKVDKGVDVPILKAKVE